MLDWLKKRRLSDTGRKRLLISMARAEEALIETHVSNILDVAEALEDEIDVARAVELYLDRIALEDTLAASVTNRLLARLEQPQPRPPRPGRTAKPGRRYRNIFREER